MTVSTHPGAPQSAFSKVVIVTGLSGAGKSTALGMFEDLGFEVVDNLPLVMMESIVATAAPERRMENAAPPRLALGVDCRTRDFDAGRLLDALDSLRRNASLSVDLVFLDADDDVLIRRFAETRRRHPLAGDDLPVSDGVHVERRMLAPLRERSDVRLDSSRSTTAALREDIAFRYGAHAPGLRIMALSFGFRRGPPREAELMFDVRFLRNPHYEESLRPLSGRDPPVQAYVIEDPDFESFFKHLTALIGPLLPRYEAEGKSYLTIAVGCTGGRHRSVTVVERLGAWLRGQGRKPVIRHRDC